MWSMPRRSSTEQSMVTSAPAISIFNASGRFVWASGSDYIGRRNTYSIFFLAQFVLFLLIPRLAASGNWMVFQVSLFTVFTMYGGGFATIPAFLADIFGPENVGAIHGALLTAWSAAAIVGPMIITEMSNRARAAVRLTLSSMAGESHGRLRRTTAGRVTATLPGTLTGAANGRTVGAKRVSGRR